jgi:hypothetical protein
MNQKFLLPASLFCAAALSFTAAAAAPPVSRTTYNYYVATNGDDANPGTAELPFQTILRASKVSLPGTTVHVAPGIYTGGFKTTMSGTEGQRIYYISTVRWGAKLVPPISSETKAGWDNRGSYVDIVGFEIDGSGARNGIKWTHGIYNGGSYTVIKNNLVHHIAQFTPCTSSGGAGIGVDSYYRGIKSDVIGNTVHNVGAPGCRFVQGIYISTSGTAHNNVVYGIGGAAIQMWHDANNVVVSNNTVSGSSTGILVGGGDYYHTRGPNDYTSVHNNIVVGNQYGISEQGDTGRHNSYRNNLVVQNAVADWRLANGLIHVDTVAQAPDFVRYGRRGAPDFRLRDTSPAINKGTPMLAIPTDIAGRARTLATGIDIGAYQH